ncbi:MAG: phosphoenolpyruvate carboxylase [Spirochaetaceae bacterium]|nr:MAG: phosphoenolpyruvate carboxylase [Spirochaetaceae bacterium]
MRRPVRATPRGARRGDRQRGTGDLTTARYSGLSLARAPRATAFGQRGVVGDTRPLDEARSLLWYLEHIFYPVAPRVHRRLLGNLVRDPRERARIAPRLELGFWPGGDRDGNPFVTSDSTLEIGALLRRTILLLYLADLRALSPRLTFAGVTERIQEIQRRLERTIAPIVQESTMEGIHPAADRDGSVYRNAEEYAEDLDDVLDRLVTKHHGLYAEQVEQLLVKVRTFGFHFASMDIRQDSSVHRRLVAEIVPLLPRPDQTATILIDPISASEDERCALVHELAPLFPLSAPITEALPEGTSRDTLLSLEAAATIQSRNGERGVHRYIISHTMSAADVLEVWLLARCAGRSDRDVNLDIVPLFESIADLQNARRIMERLYNDPIYREHLASRGQEQTIMVGFSDGTKDGGYVTANWEIYRAKQRLTEVSRAAGIRVVFFDGRGGPPARGGGNTHLYYRALGREIESREIQLTIQGQTISSKFGTEDVARYNLEQLLSAGIENELFTPDTPQFSSEDVAVLDKLSERSRAAYLELRTHPDFLPYLEQMTPLRFYGLTNIGSRPTSRTAGAPLSLDNLRAIPFVGAWSQMKQNVPGYFGFGSGLNDLFTEGDEKRLFRLFERSLFFRTMVENSMQSLSKTNFDLTAFLDSHPRFGEFWRRLRDEARRTDETFERLSASGASPAVNPSAVESIRIRERMILPVLVIQQYALAMLRDEPSAEITAVLEKLVIKSLAPSINASRNAV